MGTRDGTMESARGLLGEARAIYESIQDHNGLGNVAWGLGNSHLQDGAYEAAEEMLEEAAAAYRMAGNQFGLSWTLFELADVNRRLGRPDDAWPHIEGALKIFRESRDVSGVVLASASAAAIAYQSGDLLRAYRLSGSVATLVEESGTELVGQAFNIVEGLEPETLAALTGRDREAYEEGRAMSYEETVAYALSGPVDL
jgi:tetratricopeptide (TPR) repeat protein